MPRATAPRKIADVQALGGHCDLVDDPSQVYERAAWHAARGACHLDQFGLAERATDWRGNNNIAESIIGQLAGEPQPAPAWVVCGPRSAERRVGTEVVRTCRYGVAP